MIILKELDHPNLVRLFEVYQDSKYYYMVLEHCKGGELFDRIKKIDNLTDVNIKDIMR
jgi:calcium-dependent protein kinase